ncbi:MAG TPA: hypothetical protein VGB26_01230, partial [Nitrospiria bacterium]
NIRLIKRRIIGPVSACVLDSSSNQDPVKKGTGYFFLLDVCQPYRIPAFAGMTKQASGYSIRMRINSRLANVEFILLLNIAPMPETLS